MHNNNYFSNLADVDLTALASEKMGLTYVSWAGAWANLKAMYPTAFYTIYENHENLMYHNDGRSAWVKCGVTIPEVATEHWNGEHIEYLPVMDNRNKSVLIESPTFTSMAVNNAVQRCITKAIARHGLGISLYIDGSTEGLGINDIETQQTDPVANKTFPELKQIIKKMLNDTSDAANKELRRIYREVREGNGEGDVTFDRLRPSTITEIISAWATAGYDLPK